MHRALIPLDSSKPKTLSISERSLVHHLLRVLRVQPGEAIECLDGNGHAAQGRIDSVSSGEIGVCVSKWVSQPGPNPCLTLALSLIKPEPFEWAIQKATELGVSRIVPLMTERTRIKRTPEGWDSSRLKRWQRIVESSVIQCGRLWLPAVEAPVPFSTFITQAKQQTRLLCAAEGVRIPLSMAIERTKETGQNLAVAIGPEGDFSVDEISQACQHGWQAISLGSAILRAETAAVYVLSICQYALGDFSKHS